MKLHGKRKLKRDQNRCWTNDWLIKCSGREWVKGGALIFSEGNRVNVEVQRDYRAGLRGLGWGSPCSHWHCCSPGCTPCWRCASADANTEGKKTMTTDFLFLDDVEPSHWNNMMKLKWAAVTLAASSLCLWLGLSRAGLLLGLWLRTGLFAKSLMSLLLYSASCPACRVASSFSLSSR